MEVYPSVNYMYEIKLAVTTALYENMPMQNTEIILAIKIENCLRKRQKDIFLIFAQNIDCGYTLEPPR